MVIGLKPDRVADCRRLHAAVWPGVLEKMRRNGWAAFDIFVKKPENLVFGTFEFHGNDFAASGGAIAADPETQARWRGCEPCQKPLSTRRPGEWRAMTGNIFHMD